MFAFRISTDTVNCVRTCTGPKRRNRNNRIARKWLKKYGVKYSECKGGKTFQVGNTIYTCPHIADKIAKSVPNTS